VKLLLTSGGVTNPSIHAALVHLLGKPVDGCHALCVPTAQWGHPMCGPTTVQGFVAAKPDFRYLSGLGWRSLGVLELTALPSIGEERWVPWVREADVLLVDGGDATYLCHWMRESGLADLLPSLPDLVWVGVSAGNLDAFPTNTLANAERWAAGIGGPAYAIDEQTAIKVVDGAVEVISEGNWTAFGS
jgi:dipeptidase E